MKYKVGKTTPNMSLVDAIFKHHEQTTCKCKGYIIRKPSHRIEKISLFSLTYYNVESWYCPICKWESEKIITRIV